jgi:N6-L-threonylcarbamoyladenine synthase
VEVLVSKTIRAAEQYKVKTIILGGGVAANSELREGLRQKVASLPSGRGGQNKKIVLLMPEIKFTGDNAVMIALAGYFRINKTRNQQNKKSKKQNLIKDWRKVKVDPNLRL